MEDPSFEHLISRRLVIRRFASGDAEALASYRSDAEVARYQDWECPYPVSEARKFIASLQHLAPGTPGTWFQFAVSLASVGHSHWGRCPSHRRADARQAELGFTFAAAHQGQGYATEAVRAVVQSAFRAARDAPSVLPDRCAQSSGAAASRAPWLPAGGRAPREHMVQGCLGHGPSVRASRVRMAAESQLTSACAVGGYLLWHSPGSRRGG